MKCGMRMAGAVGVGYVLGRTRKMKFALMLAGVGMSGRGGPQALLERATSAVGSAPELAKITDTVRGELLDAARSAAVTAASNRIDALNTRLQQHDEVAAGSGESDSGDETDTDTDLPDEDERPAPAPRKTRSATGTRSSAAGVRRRSADGRARTPAANSGSRGAAGSPRSRDAAVPRRRAAAEESTAEAAPIRRTRR